MRDFDQNSNILNAAKWDYVYETFRTIRDTGNAVFSNATEGNLMKDLFGLREVVNEVQVTLGEDLGCNSFEGTIQYFSAQALGHLDALTDIACGYKCQK